jgi:hypothetical protein
MTKHVISTLSADNRYADFITQPGVSTINRAVVVKGGAGVVALGASRAVAGVTTEVSDEDAAFLANHKLFQDHQKRGFVRIVDKPVDPEKAAQKMEKDDGETGADGTRKGGSAPLDNDDIAVAAKKAAEKSGLKPEETLQVVAGKSSK